VARKFVDGIASTYLAKGEYQKLEEDRKGEKQDELKEAVAFLKEDSPSGSEEHDYEEAFGGKKEGQQKGSLRDKKKSKTGTINEVGARLGETVLIETGVKQTPEKRNSDGVANESKNRLLSSPTLHEIAKVGTTKAGMLGLMDQLASAVVDTTERMKSLEKRETKPNIGEGHPVGDQLASMMAMMAQMM
jgi:hypothetical protein